ncbi:MAG: hypothetical protein KBS98_02485 [Flavobacterium sp.]|nr:hypothetical protein [Candidatus Neoflavobacterium equi]
MASNKNLMMKGIKKIIFAFPFLFIGPMVIFSSFKNEGHPFFIPILGLGIIMCAVSAFTAFKGLKTITDALFNDTEN